VMAAFMRSLGGIRLRVTLLRWIDHLSRLGRVTETTRRVEEAVLRAVKSWQKAPNLGGNPLAGTAAKPGAGDTAVFTDRVGYVQHIDGAALSKIAEELTCDVVVMAIPGKMVSPGMPLGWLEGKFKDDVVERIADCFVIDDVRSFDQDPRFGAAVLTEIASRALSPAVNDPGTAIDIISRAVRILLAWKESQEANAESEVPYPRLRVASISTADLFDDLFTPIARDGAAIVEVGLRLQKAFRILATLGPEFRKNAVRHSKEALERAGCPSVRP